MPSGGHPKPTHLKALQGNPGKRKLNKKEPKTAKSPALKPAWLCALAEEQWNIYLPIVTSWGFGTETDRMALEGLCDAYAEWRLLRQYVIKHGPTYSTPMIDRNGEIVGERIYARHEVKMAGEAWRRMMVALDRFGLNPSARSKIQVAAPTEEDETAKELFGT